MFKRVKLIFNVLRRTYHDLWGNYHEAMMINYSPDDLQQYRRVREKREYHYRRKQHHWSKYMDLVEPRW